MGPSHNETKSSWIALAIVLSAAGLLALILYWPTLRLPLIYDDLLHIRITGGLDLLSVWLPTQAFGFYRPLTFLPLLIVEDLFGQYPAGLLHGLNVFQHALNVVLLGLLSWRLYRRLHWTVASVLLMALFPFSYQAIAVYGHNVHPTTTGILLLALNTYLSAIGGPRYKPFWWLVTAALFVLALLSHESAVLFGALAALVHWNFDNKLPAVRRGQIAADLGRIARRPWFVFLAAAGLYFIGYRLLPLTRAPQASFEGASLWYKFLYVAQAAVHPLAWFGRWLPDDPTLAAATVLFGLTAALALTFWSARDRANRLPLLLGWGWWALASLVITLPLETSYVLHGPRLLYLAGAGLALLWPVLLEPIYKLHRFGRLLWGAILVFILVTNLFFVRDRLLTYDRLTDPVAKVQWVMGDLPAAEGILLVNLPSWMSPERNQYPIGVELVSMMGGYLFVEELMAQNLPADHPVRAVRVHDLLNDAPYNYGIHEQARGDLLTADWAPAGSHIFVITYDENGPQTTYRGRLVAEQAGARPIATFGPYNLLAAEAQLCASEVTLTSLWRASDPAAIPPTASLFVQLLDADGRLISQADGPPLGLRADLLELAPGWQIDDRRRLPVEGEGTDQVLLGVYDFASGQRFPAAANGQPLADNALRIPLDDCRP